MPFKLNQDRRHHIPKQKHKVTNWREYDAGLRRRGSLTVWFTDEAIQAWRAEPRTTRGGQPWYSPLAILTALTLRAVFRLPFRQTEGPATGPELPDGRCWRPQLPPRRRRSDTRSRLPKGHGMTLILIIVVLLLLLFGGGGFYGYRSGYYGAGGFGGILGLLVLLAVLYLIFGGGLRGV